MTGGKARRETGTLHHRDGDNAGGHDVGDRDARYRAEQAGRDDRYLGRAAAVAPHQHQGNVAEELRAAGAHQQLAEKDEGDDNGCADHHCQPEQRAGVEGQIGDERAEFDLPGLERARHQMADHGIGDADGDDDRQRIADRAAQALDAQHHEDDRNDQHVERVGIELFAEFGENDGDVGAGAEARGCRRQIVQRHARPFAAPPGRIVQKDEGERGAQHAGQELFREQHQADIAVHVRRPGERAQGQQRRQYRTDIAQHRTGRRCAIVLFLCPGGRGRISGRLRARRGHLAGQMPFSL